MKKISGIYKIINIQNSKLYIGSAENIDKRWGEHRRLLINKKHHSGHLQNSYNLYGVEKFKYEIIENCPEDILIKREQYYIDLYETTNPDKGYNECPTAGSRKGIKNTPEAIEKQRQSMMGKFVGEKSPTSKLTWDETYKIRKEYSLGNYTQKQLSEKYNISCSQIRDIINNVSWKKDDIDIIDVKKIKSNNYSKHQLGENNSTSKLTWEEVREIRKLWLSGEYTHQQISEKFNVKRENIGQILRNKSWKDVNYIVTNINHNKKLNEMQIKEIREKWKTGNYLQKQLADEYDTSRGNIRDIIQNKNWKDSNYIVVNINHSKKLNQQQVNEIRQKYSTGNFTYLQLSKEYKISAINIGQIVRNERWKDQNYKCPK